MKKKPLPHLLTVILLIVFIVLGLASASLPTKKSASKPSTESNQLNVVYYGESNRLLEGTSWILTASDWPSDRQPNNIDFFSNGIVNGFNGNTSTWERKGFDVRLVIEDGRSFIEGKYNPENFTITGTISRSNGSKANILMQRVSGNSGNTLDVAITTENTLQRQAGAQHSIQPANPFFNGTGGRGISLGIGTPKSQGLSATQDYLPTLVQGVLVDSISKYSAVKVLDRVSLDRVIATTLDPTFEDNIDIVRIGHVAHVENWLTGNIIRTSSGYTLQLNITDTTPNALTVATYTGTCTVEEFDNHSAIHKAAMALLEGMGIELTDRTKTELTRASSQQYVQVQTVLSQGITAQRQGQNDEALDLFFQAIAIDPALKEVKTRSAETVLSLGLTAQQQGNEIEALGYFLQAAALDPSLADARTRSSVASANIKTGSIGTDARNDIEWRRRWVARLTETEEFYNRMFSNRGYPYRLFYSTRIHQGNIDYQNETIELSFNMNLRINPAWVSTLDSVVQTVQAVYDGLNATERKVTWGLGGNWSDVWKKQINSDTFNTTWRTDFSIIFELLNEKNTVIGRRTVNLTNDAPTFIVRREGDKIIRSYTEDIYRTITFNAVKVNDITENMAIRIASANRVTPENARFQMMALPDEIYYTNAFLKVEYGAVNGFRWDEEKRTNLVIPSEIWGEPNAVTSINSNAFRYGNKITDITIPDSVKYIGRSNYRLDSLTSVIIGENVEIEGNGYDFNREFTKFYNDNRRQAGTYTWNGNRWNYRR